MKTEVIMNRKLDICDKQMLGGIVRQKSKTEYFSATDLIRNGNILRKQKGMHDFNLSQYLKYKDTIIFVNSLENKIKEKAYIKGRGRGSNTWVHPLLFIDIALAISPDLKIEVYSWLSDKLLQYRNISGESYKKMCGSLYENCTNKTLFPKAIVKTAEMIQKACGVSDWNNATQEQLELRDKIHDNISLLSDVLRDNNQAIRIGILKALENK